MVQHLTVTDHPLKGPGIIGTLPKFGVCLVFVLLLLAGCKTIITPSLPIYRDKDRFSVDTLGSTEEAQLRGILSAWSPGALRDTLYIKYHFNGESCWDALDAHTAKHIRGFITRHQDHWAALDKERPAVSLFHIREPGEDFNKLIKWDDDIHVDYTRRVYDLLVREKAQCGTSFLVLPGGKILTLRSDAHAELLLYRPARIEWLLQEAKVR
jgi:hypothetical protein